MPNPLVTDSELELLKELWKESPLSGPELIARTLARTAWDESTAKTLLTRLVTKGVIFRKGKRRSYQYSPLLTKDAYQREAAAHLAAQAFDNSAAELVTFFGSSAFCAKNGKRIAGPPVQSSLNPA